MEKNILNLAGVDYIVECNFRKQHDLTKFRNKLSYGMDFTEADKDVIGEIFNFQQNLREGEDVDLSNLSPEAMQLLRKTANKTEVFDSDELIEIGMILANIKLLKKN